MNNRMLIIGGVILALLLVLWLAMSGSRSDGDDRDLDQTIVNETEVVEASEPDDTPLNFDHVWREASVEYDPECAENCTEVLSRPQGAHGGSVRVGVKPAIDDPVAQRSDCVQTIMSCYEGRLRAEDFDGEKDRVMHDCILSSACPEECRDHYQSTVSENLSAVNAALDSVFLGERAACLPTEAWVE